MSDTPAAATIPTAAKAAAAIAAGLATASAAPLPRGIRNNNPGNLRPGPAWQGIAGLDTAPPDPPYLRFVDPEHGIRALARTLISYRDRHGIDTLAAVFARWAPAGDGNDPDRYAAAVAQALGQDAAAPVDLHDPVILAALAAAITHQENGDGPGATGDSAWYSAATYRRGVALAVSDAPASPPQPDDAPASLPQSDAAASGSAGSALGAEG